MSFIWGSRIKKLSGYTDRSLIILQPMLEEYLQNMGRADTFRVEIQAWNSPLSFRPIIKTFLSKTKSCHQGLAGRSCLLAGELENIANATKLTLIEVRFERNLTKNKASLDSDMREGMGIKSFLVEWKVVYVSIVIFSKQARYRCSSK